MWESKNHIFVFPLCVFVCVSVSVNVRRILLCFAGVLGQSKGCMYVRLGRYLTFHIESKQLLLLYYSEHFCAILMFTTVLKAVCVCMCACVAEISFTAVAPLFNRSSALSH